MFQEAPKLTPREKEVLHWVIQGKTNQEIAIILGIATGTVAKHVEHLLRKLGVETRTAAARVASEHQFSFSGNGAKGPRAIGAVENRRSDAQPQ